MSTEIFHGLKLLSRCGGGAYGDVYYCEDVSGRRMAVKIVSKSKLGDAWERELRGVINYRRITENASGLLQIYHVEEDKDSFFYTMEAADSLSENGYSPDTLAARLENGPLPQESLFEILSAIFAGIKAIHDAGFAHRDIKPDNILFVGGVPKLGDIGLLSSLTTTVTQIAGTMDFLPPELRTEEGTTPSSQLARKRNDLYAFGKVVYCAVTGQDPHSWPALPKELPLSLPLKLFLRLSIQLCDKDPARRMRSTRDLQKELADIKRKLASGETLRDRITYHVRRSFTAVRGCVIHAARFFCRHWLAALIFCAIAGGGIWCFRPKPPFDITKQQTKVYTNKSLGFSMTVPFQWEIISAETVRKTLEEAKQDEPKEKDPIEKRREEFFALLFQAGGDFIFCDFDENFWDNIVIQTLPGVDSKQFDVPDDELRFSIRQLYQGELGFKTEIYEIRRMDINGQKCIFIDLSHEPQKTRINNYVFLLPDRCFAVALTAKTKGFPERQMQFSQIVRTIKFTKK